MKKITKHILISILFCAFIAGCQVKHKTDESCIVEKIAELQKNKSSQFEIWRYEYNGATVYFFPSTGGDQMSTLYNEDCQIICRPDGGLMGTGDGKCSDFFEKRENGKVLTTSK